MAKFEDYKIVIYKEDNGVWIGRMPAFEPHVIAMKDTQNELIEELKLVFEDVIDEYHYQNRSIPKSDKVEFKIA